MLSLPSPVCIVNERVGLANFAVSNGIPASVPAISMWVPSSSALSRKVTASLKMLPSNTKSATACEK
jgi:hypothetical protein